MSEIFFSCILFFISLLIQLFAIKFLSIKREILMLLIVFIIIPIFLNILNWYFNLITLNYISSIILLLGLSGSYLQTYPALKNDIPTFKILFFIDQFNKNKINIDRTKLIKLFNINELENNKVKELINDGLIKKSNDYFSLTLFGNLMAYIFKKYRCILNLDRGKG